MSISISGPVQAVEPVRLRRHLGLDVGFTRGSVFGLTGVVGIISFAQMVKGKGFCFCFRGFRISIRVMLGFGWVGCV